MNGSKIATLIISFEKLDSSGKIKNPPGNRNSEQDFFTVKTAEQATQASHLLTKHERLLCYQCISSGVQNRTETYQKVQAEIGYI